MRLQRFSREAFTEIKEYSYNLSSHIHGDHSHFNLKKISEHSHDHEMHDHSSTHDDHRSHLHSQDSSHLHHEHDHAEGSSHVHNSECGDCDDGSPKKLIARSDEGCPCCVAAIDLDEVATAINEITKTSKTAETHSDSLGKLADFSSSAHWGIFLGISGPMALIGLTAAIRNIKGTLNNRQKLEIVIKGLEEDILRYSNRRDTSRGNDKKDLGDVVKRLEAFRETLKYSKFDTNFNLIVPGFINGAASTIVLSSAVLSSPFALPVIGLYAGCQTLRNGYDLWRTWNRILPEDIRRDVQLNMNVGIRKINQITDSKRKFYAANTLGFTAFTAGSVITTLSLFSGVGAPGLAVGLPLLAAGAVSTGITNNIWTAKFKPRNGDLGIDRTKLDMDRIKQEIGERREIKKLLKNYRDRHLPSKLTKRFGCSLLSSLPFLNDKGQKLLHRVNQSRISESNSNDGDRLDLLERAINAKIILKKVYNQKAASLILKKISGLEEINLKERRDFGLITLQRRGNLCEHIFKACVDLEIDTLVLDRFIKNTILKSRDEHDASIKTKEEYFSRLRESGLFTINSEQITFNLESLERNIEMKRAFMNSLEECLLFDYVEKLKYEQYGLNDFYWAVEKQNKKESHSHSHEHHRHKHRNDLSHNHGHHAHDHSHEELGERHEEDHHDHEHHRHSHESHRHLPIPSSTHVLAPLRGALTNPPPRRLSRSKVAPLPLNEEESHSHSHKHHSHNHGHHHPDDHSHSHRHHHHEELEESHKETHHDHEHHRHSHESQQPPSSTRVLAPLRGDRALTNPPRRLSRSKVAPLPLNEEESHSHSSHEHRSHNHDHHRPHDHSHSHHHQVPEERHKEGHQDHEHHRRSHESQQLPSSTHVLAPLRGAPAHTSRPHNPLRPLK